MVSYTFRLPMAKGITTEILTHTSIQRKRPNIASSEGEDLRRRAANELTTLRRQRQSVCALF